MCEKALALFQIIAPTAAALTNSQHPMSYALPLGRDVPAISVAAFVLSVVPVSIKPPPDFARKSLVASVTVSNWLENVREPVKPVIGDTLSVAQVTAVKRAEFSTSLVKPKDAQFFSSRVPLEAVYPCPPTVKSEGRTTVLFTQMTGLVPA